MNQLHASQKVTIHRTSAAVAQLVPNILRGVQLDFFVRKGVTQTQFLVLLALRAYGCCTMTTLAHSLHVQLPTATGIVSRLVAAGYLKRAPHPADRRQVIVELTAKGQTFIQEFQAVVRRRWEEVLQSLSPTELAAFHRILTKLDEQLRIPPQSPETPP